MNIRDTDVDTEQLKAALEEKYSGNIHVQYGALLYLACSVAAGDNKDGIDSLRKLVTRGKELMGSDV